MPAETGKDEQIYSSIHQMKKSSNYSSFFSRAVCVIFLALLGIACSSQPKSPPAKAPQVKPAAPVEGSTLPQPEQQLEPAIATESPALVPEPQTPPAQGRRLQIGAVGDVMLGTDFPENWLADDDGASLLSHVVPILRQPDVTFINFEGTLLDGGEPRKRCPNPKTCYLFRTPERYVKYLVEAGVDVASLANNHARDFGESGRGTTMQVLAAAGIRHSGLDGDVASWEVKGLRVAMIAYAPFAYSHDFLDIPRAQRQVRDLAADHDIVIVSMHAGAEGVDFNRVTFKREVFHGENRGNVHEFSHAVIDAGADLVIGHGPHVVRALELYQDRLIAYSLGNFATYFGISVSGKKGYAPILLVDLDEHGRFIEGRIVSAIQKRPGGPVVDFQHRAAREIAELTQADFPDTPLRIGPYGSLMRLEQLPPTVSSSR